MTPEQGFLDALRIDPDDDTTRLIYADWLDEHDDPRGAYLRQEVELAGVQEEDPRYGEVEQSLRDLRPGIAAAWIEQAGKRFDVVLHGYEPTSKIAAIKVVREPGDFGLAQTKYLVETLPCCVRLAVVRAEAERWRDRLQGDLGDRVDVEVAATSFRRPIYGVHAGGYPLIDSEQARASIKRLLNVSEAEAAALCARPPVPIRDGLLLHEAKTLWAKEVPWEAFQVRRCVPAHVCPVPLHTSIAGSFDVVLHDFDPSDERFVVEVLIRVRRPLWIPAWGYLRQHLPLTLVQGRPSYEARWVWQRFRGRADVRITPTAGTADPGPAS
jgi:uncharacterized protein (TIGR02996 family)